MTDLRVLLVEDDPMDAELLIGKLRKCGYDPEWARVETPAGFAKRLAEELPDVIIFEHVMPQFSPGEALQRIKLNGLTIPFIVVSHAVGEEEGLQLMRNGAADYLMKDRLGRIGEAVRHAVEREHLRKEHAAAQQLIEEQTRELVALHHALRALVSELALAEQRERKHLAVELHDHLAQMLALGRMKMAQLRSKLDTVPAVLPLVRDLDELFTKASAYTRTLMANLNPSVLNELGLPTALRWLAEQMRQYGLAVDIRLALEHVPLAEDQAVVMFQSVRELLINVAKHAGTDRATVTLRLHDGNQLCIDVQDAGRGFDVTTISEPKPAGEHLGLLSIRERMRAMGGRLGMESVVGQGSTMTIALPFDMGGARVGGVDATVTGHSSLVEDAAKTRVDCCEQSVSSPSCQN